MKTNFKFLATLLVATGLFFNSCSEDDTDTITDSTVSSENLVIGAQLDIIDDASFDIVENAYIENVTDTRAAMDNSYFADCTVLTITPNGDGSGSILVDFGESCTLNNGAVASGQVSISYGSVQNGTRQITYTYQDFTYNSHEVLGGGTVVRNLENSNGNPQSVLNSDITVNFANTDISAARILTKTREWIEGVGSGVWTDNVFLITGSWNTSFTNGLTRSGEVVTPLRREATCPYFVSGSLAITQNAFDGVLDYGEGTCDNIATVTIAGQEFTIQL
jgi:hypothetical protein